jgi:23S rRNA pseudouridine1911/1915/1917 synthase
MTLAPAGGGQRPGIVHRLDKDTSGVMVVAKSDEAHRKLAAMFAAREVKKTYRRARVGAAGAGVGTDRRDDRPQPARPDQDVGRSAPRPDRHDDLSHRREPPAVRAARHRPRHPGGRTRFACTSRRSAHPVVGDTRYGGAPWKGLRDTKRRSLIAGFHRLALHAARLAFTHPVTEVPLAFEAPVPADFRELVEALRDEP